MNEQQKIINELKSYKKKYYYNQMVKGGILFLSGFLLLYLSVLFLEFLGNFSSPIRLSLFILLIGGALYLLGFYILKPIYGLLKLNTSLKDEEAASQIGKHFPNISDKLLNYLQLSKASDNQTDSSLLAASIKQKSNELGIIKFSSAIDFRINKKYLKYLSIPVSVFLILLLFVPSFLSSSTNRIVRFNKTFDEAPFQFLLESNKDLAFSGESYSITVKTKGEVSPDKMSLIINDRALNMKKSDQAFTYEIPSVSNDFSFRVASSGYASENVDVKVVNRPILRDMSLRLTYPNHTGLEAKNILNNGNIKVPEGTKAEWILQTRFAEETQLIIEDTLHASSYDAKTQHSFEKTINSSFNYQFVLKNEYSKNKEKTAFQVDVIKDTYPELKVNSLTDTTLYSFLLVNGVITDDYGFNKLSLFYKKTRDKKYNTIPLSLDKSKNKQSFSFSWNIDTIGLKAGEKIEYFIKVWDNDALNGYKSTSSKKMTFGVPSNSEIDEKIEKNDQELMNAAKESSEKVQKMNKELEKMRDQFKMKKELNWKDKKALNEYLKDRKKMMEELEELKEMTEKNALQEEKLKELDPEMKEKLEQLKELMENVIDEETRKLMEELQKLLQENMDENTLQEKLKELEKNESSMEKELERTLELFKQFKYEKMIKDVAKELKELAKEQKELAQETKEQKISKEEALEKQEEINKEFDRLTEKKKEAEKLNEELKRKNEEIDTESLEKEIKQNQKEGSQNLQNGDSKKGSQKQKEAGDKMQEMSDQINSAMIQQETQQIQEDLDDLRALLENVINLSFDQERVMEGFRDIRQVNPKFVELSKEQLKLSQDAELIKDSLYALANRVFVIKPAITREISDLDYYMEEAIDNIKKRRPGIATVKQQATMTSVNNLAVLLDNVLDMLQKKMANKMKGQQACQNPGNGKPSSGDGNKPSMSQMQKQLNQEIENLKKGKGSSPGNSLSKKLAKMAAQQEMIRNALKKLQDEQGKKPGGGKMGDQLSEIQKKMEETEMDIINKRITERTIERQKEIETRLLQAEKAMRERDLDEKRKGETAKQNSFDFRPDMDAYLKKRQKELELLKSAEPSLNPFFKEEVNKYFQKLSNQPTATQ